MSFGIMTPGNRRGRMTAFAIFLLGPLVWAFILLPPASRARFVVPQTPTIAEQKRSRPEFVPGDVLVRYKSEGIARRQQRTPTELKVEDRIIPIQVERFEGSDLVVGLRLARVAPEDTMRAIAALKGQPQVLYAEPNYIRHADVTPNDPCFPDNALPGCQSTNLYGLTKIGAPTAWNTTTGSNNVVVGVIDEGIDIVHADLQANIWNNPAPGSFPPITGDLHGYDFVNNSGTIPAGSHATHVGGTIGAVGNNGVGVVGVNWQVKLMSLRFISGGFGSDANAVRACSYAKQMRDLWVSSGGTQGANVRVLNNSYGGSGFNQAFLDAIRALDQSGILFVAAAGNSDDPILDNDVGGHYPSNYVAPNVISVAATDASDGLAIFSHYGAQSVHLGAPGANILSTYPGNTYNVLSGTSMSTPHVAGAAALLLAQNPNLTVQQLKSLLIFNGDSLTSLNGKTISGRRLNIANSLAALAENDVTPPGTPTNFHVNSTSGRVVSFGWTASGDDGSAGQASLYQLSFTDAVSGAVVQLPNFFPAPSGTAQTVSAKVPYGHTNGTLTLREFDNVGNEGTPTTTNVSISFVDGDPYAKTVGKAVTLSTGGAPLGLLADDGLKVRALPFPFPFFGQNFTSVTVSTNGNLFFSTPPTRLGGDADDVPGSSVVLGQFKMISGLWDDLRTDRRFGDDIYVVTPDASRIIFRWQAVTFGDGTPASENPVNFEIELRSDGTIQTRYGIGQSAPTNTGLLPVVGISGGEVDPYTIPSHTSESSPISLTNAQQVTYIPRAVTNPLDVVDFFVSQHYRDFLAREPDPGGEAFWIDQIAGNATNTPAPCAPGDTNCVNTRRINVSNAFFFELEFQQTAAYVYRMYRESFGNLQPFTNPDGSNQTEANKIPLYSKFKADREQVIGGADLAQQQLAFATLFVQRAEFINKYPANLSLGQFVDAVLATIRNDIGPDLNSQKTALVGLGSRAAVIYRLADDNAGTNPINNRAFIDAEYNRAFVFGEYSGYLRRDSDIGGFLFWLGQVNGGPLRDLTKQRAMVCSFLTSAEFQLRFSTIISHGNNECQ